MKKLKENNIDATFHYVPLHSAPYAQRALGTKNLRLPVTENVSATLLRLPIYPDLSDQEVQYVIEKIKEILK
jgi:dTDP-4-amino-4,6-dideoxygalactose transaminase